ncbi:MAG TPA: GNAT family N-acetyltransferase, partial [Anaerolineaceae bacterium]|nr:GNAT family N-acetyltransferase [Anaerolineaceae bacterium]
MHSFTIRPIRPEDRPQIAPLITRQWGADFVVAHGQIFHPADLDGFLALENGEWVGLVTYRFGGPDCEIVTIDSLIPQRGIGKALLAAVKAEAERHGCRRIWLITTNDNLFALRFYQVNGFELVRVNRRAVEAARQMKPSIPLVGESGIPIRDEIELELPL